MTARWLLIGLGNPGKQYESTRHNVGFMALERLGKAHQIMGKSETRFNAIVGTGHLAGHPVVLAQPTTFMNLSGEAVSKLTHFYQILPEHCIVIYDEAALPFGKIRVRPSGSAAGHNGIKSLIQHFGGSEAFPRVRIGIGAPESSEGNTKPMHVHVLSKFTEDEQQHLVVILDTAIHAIEKIIAEGVEPAMTEFNGLNLVPEPETP